MKSIFIFRRDYRLFDNISLIECCKKSDSILPIFIFTPEQIENNEYFSSNAFQFLLESLDELDKELKEKHNSQLHYYYGTNIEVLKKLLKEYKYDSIYFNKDYTLYAQNRDNEILDFSKNNNINCNIYEDYLLNNIGTYLKTDGTPYQKYTPFKNFAKEIDVIEPNKTVKSIFNKIVYSFNLSTLDKFYSKNNNIAVHGGRENGLKILKNIDKFSNYPSDRNILIIPTTMLSAYIKFGCISIREVYHTIIKKFGKNHTLIDQLYWREFYYYIGYYFPRVLEGKSLKEQYDKIKWENKYFKEWCNGKTGFPAVDAGIRELNETGYMHNRSRLITSGILIKILNCDWRLGEKYFATKLIDYDPIVNNGNWQWSSSSGVDSQPYFRIMSPWAQAKDNDPDCLYIKKWINELKDIPCKEILKWDISKIKSKYQKPIVDYKEMRKKIIEVYKKALY